MTGILLKGTLFISTRGALKLASTCPPDLVDQADSLKRFSGLVTCFSEETELKEINLSQTSQNQPGSRPGEQTLDEPAVYEFKIAQSLSGRWAAWFDGMKLARDGQGNTLLSGTIIDQAALHGVLTKIRDLHLILLSVMRKFFCSSLMSILRIICITLSPFFIRKVHLSSQP